VGFRTWNALHTGLNIFWNDSRNQKHMEQSNEPSHACQCTSKPHHLGVIWKQANCQNQHQRVHGYALIPTQHTNRDPHDFTKKRLPSVEIVTTIQAAKSRDQPV